MNQLIHLQAMEAELVPPLLVDKRLFEQLFTETLGPS